MSTARAPRELASVPDAPVVEASPAPAAPPADAEAALATAARLAEEFRPGAAERDNAASLPRAEIECLDASGLLAVTVPASHGGPELPWVAVAEVVRRLSAADPSLAQLLQGHLLQVDVAALLAGEDVQGVVFDSALTGGRLASSLAERGGRHAQDLRTRLVRDGDRLLLRGRKHYATGALTARWVAVSALDDADRVVVVLVRGDDPRVGADHDWNAMGQRATISGTLDLDDVVVRPELVVPYWRAFTGPQLFGARAQLVHAAIIVGIAGGALADAVDFVRTRARPFAEAAQAGWAPTAGEDPQTTRRAGRLATRVRAAEQLLRWAAETIDDIGPRPRDADDAVRGSLAVAQARAFGSEVAVEVASELFAMGGTGSTDRRLGLDRHWRNARTHSVHDPIDWKYHHLGAHLLNGTAPPNHGQI